MFLLSLMLMNMVVTICSTAGNVLALRDASFDVTIAMYVCRNDTIYRYLLCTTTQCIVIIPKIIKTGARDSAFQGWGGKRRSFGVAWA
jgi:hypothetical protein